MTEHRSVSVLCSTIPAFNLIPQPLPAFIIASNIDLTPESLTEIHHCSLLIMILLYFAEPNVFTSPSANRGPGHSCGPGNLALTHSVLEELNDFNKSRFVPDFPRIHICFGEIF